MKAGTIVTAFGAALAASLMAGTASAEEQPVQLAQANYDYCADTLGRPNFRFRPEHPRRDEQGCIPRYLVDGEGREERRPRQEGERRRPRQEGERRRPGGKSLANLPAPLAVESAHGVVPQNCEGTYQGGLCSGAFFTDIRFSQPFDTPPQVLVSLEVGSAQGGCVGGTTDKVVAFPTAVTKSGFRLYAHGSPAGCGSENGWASLAQAGWMAIGTRGAGRSAGSGGTPPVCYGRNRALQFDGEEWICVRLRVR